MIVAALLFVASGFVLAMLTFPRQRMGPEGPVGFHMVTAPLALAQSAAVCIAALAGGTAALGLPAWSVLVALPGHFVALVVLPIMALDRRHGWLARLAVAVALTGGAAMLFAAGLSGHGAVVSAWIGFAGVGAMALFAYGMLLVLWLASVRRRAAAIAAYAEQHDDFERRQAQWQLGEWRKLPAEPGLWQLIQFTHAFHPDVRQECRARVQAMANLQDATIELLGTGWAEHSLAFLRDVYPHSMSPLAPAFGKVLEEQAERWRTTLNDGSNPGSWYANLSSYVEVAERIAKDGGDLRAPMAKWAELLNGKRGLQPLAARARAIAKTAPAAAAG